MRLCAITLSASTSLLQVTFKKPWDSFGCHVSSTCPASPFHLGKIMQLDANHAEHPSSSFCAYMLLCRCSHFQGLKFWALKKWADFDFYQAQFSTFIQLPVMLLSPPQIMPVCVCVCIAQLEGSMWSLDLLQQLAVWSVAFRCTGSASWSLPASLLACMQTQSCKCAYVHIPVL